MVKLYQVKLTYFNERGKYKYEGEYLSRCDHMFEIWSEIESMQRSEKLPGLSSGSWDGPILVDVPDHSTNHPRLII